MNGIRLPLLPQRLAHYLLAASTLGLLILPVLSPLLGEAFTCGYDNSFHLWRGVEVQYLLHQGVLYPRWAADMAHGFGYPLFNFMPPLSSYVVAGLNLTGLSWARAVNFAFALGMLLSASMLYLFVRQHFGHAAGLVAGMAYAYAPFQAYDVFNRGSLSQAFAWWLPPLLMWSLGRWQRRGGADALLVATASMATLVLTHNLFTFLFGPLIVGVLFLPYFSAGRADSRPGWSVLLRGGLPLALGLGLTAFFWLPGLAERGWVQTQRLLGVWVFDYRHNFLSLRELLALPRVTDPALVNDWPPRALGLVPALVALLPALAWRRLNRPQRYLAALALIGMLGFGFMTLPLSRPLWDVIPLLPYVQFPWRFLGPAACCAAILAGAGVAALGAGRPRMQAVLGVGLTLVLFMANLGWFFPDHCSPPANPTVSGMIGWERASGTLGTTASGEYLPIWVERVPDRGAPETAVTADYLAGKPVQRLSEAELPAGAQVLEAVYRSYGADIELETPAPFRARYLAFYYPGWQASVDGEPVTVDPSHPHGFITFDVPAGRHTLTIRFGRTPLRTVAVGLSAASLGSLLLLVVWSARRCGSNDEISTSRFSNHHLELVEGPPASQPTNLTVYQFTNFPLYLLLALLLIGARWLVAQGDTPLRQTRLRAGQLEGVDHTYAVDFGHRWLLLGHEPLPAQVASGEALEVSLYWRALEPQGRNYAASVALVDAAGRRWTEIGMRSPRWHRQPPPVATWSPDQYALTAYLADLLPGTPPGDYEVILTAFDKRDPLAPLTAYAPDGTALGPELALGRICVTRSAQKPQPDEITTQVRLETDLGSLRLVGADLDRTEAAPGDPMGLTLFWHAPAGAWPGKAMARPDLEARLALTLEGTGTEAAAWDLAPVRADWPTTAWRAGDLWRGQHQLRLPGGLARGAYAWQLQLYETSGATPVPVGQAVELGTLQVNAPARLWTPPLLQVTSGAMLGEKVTLLGADLAPALVLAEGLQAPATLTITLAWQAEAEIETSYRVFLHLLGPQGALLTQSDGEPAHWTRPTLGWAPGEVVLDERVLEIPADAPPGPYRLVTGLYDPATGDRLALPGGDTSVEVATFQVERR